MSIEKLYFPPLNCWWGGGGGGFISHHPTLQGTGTMAWNLWNRKQSYVYLNILTPQPLRPQKRGNYKQSSKSTRKLRDRSKYGLYTRVLRAQLYAWETKLAYASVRKFPQWSLKSLMMPCVPARWNLHAQVSWVPGLPTYLFRCGSKHPCWWRRCCKAMNHSHKPAGSLQYNPKFTSGPALCGHNCSTWSAATSKIRGRHIPRFAPYWPGPRKWYQSWTPLPLQRASSSWGTLGTDTELRPTKRSLAAPHQRTSTSWKLRCCLLFFSGASCLGLGRISLH